MERLIVLVWMLVNIGLHLTESFFIIGLLEYMYERIARVTLHLKDLENWSYPSLASWLPRGNYKSLVDYQGGNFKTQDIVALIKDASV
jgi:hypothetical protein